MNNALTLSKQIDITRPTLAGNHEHRNRDIPISLLCASSLLSSLIWPLARHFSPRSSLLPVCFPCPSRVSRLLPACFPPAFRLQRVHSLHLNYLMEVFPW